MTAMAFLISFLWLWLLSSLFLGLATGWIAVVHRARGVSRKMVLLLSALAALLVALAFTQVIPGRLGYWLDLGLLIFVPYIVGCAIGSALRDWVVTHGAPTG